MEVAKASGTYTPGDGIGLSVERNERLLHVAAPSLAKLGNGMRINENAELNVQEVGGTSALMWACLLGRSENVRVLCEHDADVWYTKCAASDRTQRGRMSPSLTSCRLLTSRLCSCDAPPVRSR